MISTLLGSAFARGSAAVLLLVAALALGAWRLDVRAYDRGYADAAANGQAQLQALRDAQAKANAEAQAQIEQWRSAASKTLDQYLAAKETADVLAQQQAMDLATQPGADAPLSPYLSHAARLLYAGPQ